MRRVKIDSQVISLPDKDVIGVGGEATVFRCNGEAIKLYLVQVSRHELGLTEGRRYAEGSSPTEHTGDDAA